MINAQRLFSLQSLLDEYIINAQVLSTIGYEEVVVSEAETCFLNGCSMTLVFKSRFKICLVQMFC